jgi:hypothetical protein
VIEIFVLKRAEPSRLSCAAPGVHYEAVFRRSCHVSRDVGYKLILLQKSKIDQSQKSRETGFLDFLLLRRLSAPLGRSVVDFG